MVSSLRNAHLVVSRKNLQDILISFEANSVEHESVSKGFPLPQARMLTPQFAGASVLITGASSGIGAACAVRLRDRGWRVLAGVRREGTAPDG